jgi:RecA/RadA recombinase
MSLIDKLKKNTTSAHTELLAQSFENLKTEPIQTPVPMVNVALSGEIDGGLLPGSLVLAGPSKHFKSAFALLIAGAFMNKHNDGVLLFYDSEFGLPEQYFTNFNIPMDRVIHTPVTNVEELKFDMMQQLNGLEKEDNICIVVDSIGNLASNKEVEDALEGKSVADMTRAKAFKSLFRMITPHLNLKHIPLILVNHTYSELSIHPRQVVSGGTGIYYSSDNIWIIGRQQEKDGTEVAGYNFIINVDKSRFVREKSKIPISVTFEGGIKKWSGLFEEAVEGGFILNPSKGYYSLKEDPEAKFRKSKIDQDSAFWKNMLDNDEFKQYIEDKYKLGNNMMIEESD